MPHKKRNSTARMSADAKRKAALRVNEKCEDRETRLTHMRTAAASSKTNELFEQREARLPDMKTRAASSRANELSEEREARLADMKTRDITTMNFKQKKSYAVEVQTFSFHLGVSTLKLDEGFKSFSSLTCATLFLKGPKIKTKTDFLHLPSKDAKSRDWEKERKRLIGYDLHCATLGEYHRQGKIPRGLRCNLRPTLFSENEKYCATFQKILNKCSFDIILLTIEYLQEAIKTTEEKIESIETQLTSTLSSTEFTTLKGKVDSILTIHQKTLEERKRTKFQRDIEDYLTNNVYKWEDSFPKRPRPRYRRTPGGNYHSGGSSPAGAPLQDPAARLAKMHANPEVQEERTWIVT
ncbi:unnamed protein product [Ranitomeya imitator]|uniref:STPR domain-containing protein n=1 Tax=Ranitomeya imitator TaxID=111125 RepID=A0ABN9LTV8_9NEOB|nr:unnamed protein product [Ranitomeya imitator]